MDNKIRILTVDDSAFMRKAIQLMLKDDPDIEVIGVAHDGQEGLEKVMELKPDLVTMDIEMPKMDGLTALKMIMEKRPTPVIMVSSLTSEGAKITLDALDMGAVDFIPKQSSFVSLDIAKIKTDLTAKIRHIYKRRHTLMSRYVLKTGRKKAQDSQVEKRPTQQILKPSAKKNKHVNLVAIGTSTGGPPALQTVLEHLPRNFPTGVVIVQHMPPLFTKSMAERLNRICNISVKEAEDGETIAAGIAYVAPGDQHLVIRKAGIKGIVKLTDKPANMLHMPSVDILMKSVAESHCPSVVGVIMTGMGHDGLNGLQVVKSRGGDIIAQDEETCVVYGMPRAVVEANIANTIVPLEQIPSEIMSYF